jgi:hypothetical protein
MDAYNLCSKDKDLNPKTCKFSIKCKPGFERDEKFLCKKNANVGKATESLKQRLSSYLASGENKTLGLNIKQLKKKLTGKNDKAVSNSLNRMLEQIKEHQARNPSKKTRKKMPKVENRMVVRVPSKNSSVYYGMSSKSRSASRNRSVNLNAPNSGSLGLNGSNSNHEYRKHLKKDRKPYQNKYGNPLGEKI